MTVCNFETITKNIEKNCDVVIPGKEDLMYAVPMAYIDKSACTFNVSNPLIMEDFVLKDNSPDYSSFEIHGSRGSNDATAKLAPSTYKTGFNHEGMFYIFDNDPVASKLVAEYAETPFVLIVKNKYNNRNKVGTPSDSLYQVYGYDSGLYLSEADNSNADAQGGWFMKAATSSKSKEPNPPLTLFKTSAAVTEAMVLALL
jgi:hypothetical protein